MLRPRLSAGVEIGGGSVRLVLLQPKPVPTVLRCREFPLGPGDEGAAGRLVAKALAEIGAKGANVHLAFSIPGAPPAKLLNAPKLKRSELRQVALRDLRRDAQMDASKLYFEIERLGTVALEGGTTAEQYLVASLAQPQLDEVAGTLHSARYVLRSAISSSLGVLKAAGVSDLPKGKVVAVAHLDPRRSSLVIVEDGVPRFFRDFPTDQSRMPDEEMLCQAIARELDLSLVYFMQQHRPKQVDSVLVVGTPVYADRVIELLDSHKSYGVVRFGPGEKLKVAPGVSTQLGPYAAAIGAALGEGAVPVPNVLPTELRGQPERLMAIVASSLVILATVGGILQVRATHTERLEVEEARVQAAQQQLSGLVPKVDAIARMADAAGHAEKWNGFFDAQDTRHHKLGHLLVELSRVLPDNGRLSKVTLEPAEAPAQNARTRRAAARRNEAAAAGNQPTHKLKVEGIVQGADLAAIQPALLAFDTDIKNLPGVLRADRHPWKSSRPERGVEEIAFSVELFVELK